MTIYQAELLRHLPLLGCIGYYGYRDGLIHIFHEDFPLCRQTPNGFLRFCGDQLDALSQTELYYKVQEEASVIREYVSLYEAAPGRSGVAGLSSERYFYCGLPCWTQIYDTNSSKRTDL